MMAEITMRDKPEYQREKNYHDHINHFVPGILQLLNGDPGFNYYMVRRGMFVSLQCGNGTWLWGAATFSEPTLVGESAIYGAIRVIAPFPYSQEQCLAAVAKWLSLEQRKGMENGKMFAVIGVAEWGKQTAIVVAMVAA